MRRVSTSWLPIGILAVLAAVTFWLKEVVDDAAPVTRAGVQHHPDLIVASFSAHQLGPDGHTRYTLEAKTMTHYPDDDASDFDGVHLTAYEPGQPALQVSADQGARRVDQERVTFTGNVEVRRQGVQPDDPPLVMHTRVLDVYPDRKLGVANEPVHLEHGADRLEADNMTFDNKLSIAEFTRAKATLPPTPR